MEAAMAMSIKFETMMKILNRINRGDKVTVDSLADEIGVKPRTVERYIETLRKAEFPIQYDRSHGSYVFEEGYSLRRADLNEEETLVLALSKSMLKQFGNKTGKLLDTIEKKLGTGSTVLPDHIILGECGLPPVVEGHLKQLNASIIESHQVELDYRATYKNDEKTCRTVDPYYLLFKENMWYLRAFCRLRQELRTFALDKIDSLTVLDKHFVKKADFKPNAQSAGSFHVVMDGEPTDVILRFDKKVKPYLLRQKWDPSQQNRELPDGRLEVHLRVNGFVGLKPWLYGWIPNVEVVEPEELRRLFRHEMEETLKQFG
jgi:predicted DNA-binding transcriptional regulator YafY